MSEEKPAAPASTPPPQLPARAEELFRLVFKPAPAVAAQPPAPANAATGKTQIAAPAPKFGKSMPVIVAVPVTTIGPVVTALRPCVLARRR